VQVDRIFIRLQAQAIKLRCVIFSIKESEDDTFQSEVFQVLLLNKIEEYTKETKISIMLNYIIRNSLYKNIN